MNIKYDEKLPATVAFSNVCLCSKELVQKEHRHFHPSGCCEPSKQDDETANRLREAGKLIGIELLDFMIIGNESYSYRECGRL